MYTNSYKLRVEYQSPCSVLVELLGLPHVRRGLASELPSAGKELRAAVAPVLTLLIKVLVVGNR